MNENLVFIVKNIVPIVSLILTIIVAITSYKTNKKSLKQQKEINKKSLEQQKEIAEKNLHANIISESRIEWIQEVRKLMADYLQKAACFPFYYGEYYDNDSNAGTEKAEKQEIDNRLMEIQALEYLLLLYFSDNDGNKEIRTAIKVVIEYLNNIVETFPKTNGFDASSEYKYDDATITNLLKVATDYFKKEWERAKKLE
ncbi:hypothetical protein [Clostridium tagluense]|uniref:hypothetical protein n=1 Tax=Clostridium tagluense TaxID=360422 RepID=UPI001CF39D65|nr:hypothetical protein [Clostridium tagluense]MCB2300673.1 hypothetical protein [Clostridium tagluense]